MADVFLHQKTCRFAYADPPYPGQSKKHYEGHPDYAGGWTPISDDGREFVYREFVYRDGPCGYWLCPTHADEVQDA